jgi:hypothetical protein
MKDALLILIFLFGAAVEFGIIELRKTAIIYQKWLE